MMQEVLYLIYKQPIIFDHNNFRKDTYMTQEIFRPYSKPSPEFYHCGPQISRAEHHRRHSWSLWKYNAYTAMQL